jgi:tetratricopeptide (TPR) repeat protein
MAGQEGLEPGHLSDDGVAERARGLIGADVVVAVSLSGDATGLTVAGTVRDGTTATTFQAEVPGTWSAALSKGSEAIASAVFARSKASLAKGAKAQPESSSNEALLALGECWETALRQPMGIDAPVGLSGDELDHAIEACRAALKADPSLRFAGATLALLLAVGREDAEANTVLGKSTDTDPALTPWVLARYWLLSRDTSAEAAVKFLAQVGKKHGNALLVHSLEASALGSMNEHARAVKAWNEYLALSPASAFAQGRLSHSLARLDKVEQAMTAASKGLTLAPESREARLALAARQIDAKKLDDAKATLQPLVSLPNAPAEPALQLGLAYWAAGDAASAQPLFKVASERAVGPRAWKTKGHALYALALVEAKAGRMEAAKALYSQSQDTGFTMTPADPLLSGVVAALKPHVVTPPAGASGGLYLHLAPLDGAAPTTALADTVLHDKLATLGAQFAPTGETKGDAVGVIKTRKLKGYELRVKLTPAEAEGLKVEMLVMSYPEQALKGSWSVKASGAKPEVLVRAMVARVVDDAANDLDWK